MIIIIYSFILLFIGIYSLKSSNKANPVIVLNILWAVILFLSSVDFYDALNKTSDYYYNLIFWGIIMFDIGYLVFKSFTKNKRFVFNKKRKNWNSYSINYKLCIFLFVIVDVYLLYKMSLMGISLLKNGFNLYQLGNSISDYSGQSGLINAIQFLIISPLELPLTIVFVVDFFAGKRNKTITTLGIILIVERILTTGGRVAVIQAFLVSIVCALYVSYRNKVSLKNYKNRLTIPAKKNKVKTVLILALIIAFMYFLTTMKVGGQTPIENIIMDFSISPIMFNTWGETIQSKGIYAYGSATLFGFFHPILYVLKNITGASTLPAFFDQTYNQILDTFNTWIVIGSSCRANAYASAFWYLYYDARDIGVIIGMFIWGCVSYRFNRYYVNKRNIKSLSIYSMFLLSVFYSFTDMEFYKASYILGFMMLSIFMFKKGSEGVNHE